MTNLSCNENPTIENLLEENAKLNMALNCYFLRDTDKPTSWKYSRSQAEKLAREALDPAQFVQGDKQ